VAQLTAPLPLDLPPDQAAELARVMELQAAWENLRDDPAAGNAHGPGLRERQRRYDAFRAALAGYTTRFKAPGLPELALTAPDRVAGWCRAVRAVCQRAGGGAGAPVGMLGKAYRLADRIAARLKVAPAGREEPVGGMEAAVRGLDAVIAWCDGLGSGRNATASVAAGRVRSPGRGDTFGTFHQPAPAWVGEGRSPEG
jgi:hypothetical protein